MYLLVSFTMMILQTLLSLASVASIASAFSPSTPLFGYRSTTSLCAASYDDISDIGYDVSVSKPLGVVFGENGDPYNGLRVDGVDIELNGAAAGLRVGDQLVSINGNVVVGGDFDGVMSVLRDGPAQLDLQLYRGTVRSLYTIMDNRSDENPSAQEDDVDSEVVIMDENYEAPTIDISQYNTEPLGVGDVLNAFKNLGKQMIEKDEKVEEAPAPFFADAVDAAPPAKQEEKKKSGGIFGMFKQESIQLDGDDATGTGMS